MGLDGRRRRRLFHLALNTLALTAGTVAVALPLGIAPRLLFRTSFFCTSILLGLLS